MYVTAMNEGAVPCISNAVDLLKSSECQRALESAIIVFEQCMTEQLNGKLPVDHKTLEAVQKMAHDAALKQYHSGALFDDEGTYLKKLSVSLYLINIYHLNLFPI